MGGFHEALLQVNEKLIVPMSVAFHRFHLEGQPIERIETGTQDEQVDTTGRSVGSLGITAH